MFKKQKRNSFLLFILFIAILPLITFCSKKEKVSEYENRELAEFPEISFSAIFKDKTFMSGFDKYMSDHFIGRINWIQSKKNIELAIGKNEINGIYVTDKRLIEHIEQPDYTEIDKSIKAINDFSESTGLPTYVMIAPTSAGIYEDEIPKNAPHQNQKEFIDYIYSNLNSDITAIDIYNTLSSVKNDEYIYYRTDHHWTTLGAYYAYNSAVQKLGFTPISYDKFNIEHVSDDFKGTFHSKTLYDGIEPDIIDIYSYSDGAKVTECMVNDGMNEISSDTMYFREYLEGKDKYSVFLGTNQPLVTIKTNVQNDKKLLIIKDSYAHCFAPFMTQHYSEITLLDLRYVGAANTDIIDVSEYSQALILYNASTFTTDRNVKKLSFIF